MADVAVISVKTDPKLKARASRVAEKLGVSINAVLNNELRRFAAEQSVLFEEPEAPNAETRYALEHSRSEIEAGRYHRFARNEKALAFLRDALK